MPLADFIEEHREAILSGWEAFAATIGPAARRLSRLELRDHAPQILDAIVADLRVPPERSGAAASLSGNAAVSRTAAQTHALLRAQVGFDIDQLVSEYRALRNSVLRLCRQADPAAEPSLDEVIRFDDAIDQALAESVDLFGQQVEQSRNLLLGMLSHDMRSPLQAIQATAQYLGRLGAGEAVTEAADRMIRSGARIQGLLDDLIDFNRARLGLGVSVALHEVDLRAAFEQEIEQIRAARPDARVVMTADGDCRGHWDERRLQQLLGNLILNAIDYGAPDAPVRVRLDGDDQGLRIEVANRGTPIDPVTLARIFEPLRRGDTNGRGAGLGLGLYIVDEIAKAHGGRAQVRSDSTETVFAVQLPWCGAPAGAPPDADSGDPSGGGGG